MNDDSQKSTCFAFLSFASDLFASVVVDSNLLSVSLLLLVLSGCWFWAVQTTILGAKETKMINYVNTLNECWGSCQEQSFHDSLGQSHLTTTVAIF